MVVGIEWIVDAVGCRPDRLQSIDRLRRVCERVIDELRLNVTAAPLWHAFPGAGGVTGLYLLSESHLACHTYPEAGFASFNLYCCRERPEWNWGEQLARDLNAETVSVRAVRAGSRIRSEVPA